MLVGTVPTGLYPSLVSLFLGGSNLPPCGSDVVCDQLLQGGDQKLWHTEL